MELSKVIEQRRSIRNYKAEAVKREALLAILEAARLAPSWKNSQGWRYVVVSDPQKKREIGESVHFNPTQNAYENAPYLMVLCAMPEVSGDRGGKQYFMTDAAITFEHAHLKAAELGLGMCWVGAFDEAPVKQILGIPEEVRVVALSPLGVPDECPGPRPRKAMGEIAFENEWGKSV